MLSNRIFLGRQFHIIFLQNRTSNVTQEDADCSRMLRALEDQQKAQQNEEMQEWIAASNQKEIARVN